jgi:hypothetical protein
MVKEQLLRAKNNILSIVATIRNLNKRVDQQTTIIDLLLLAIKMLIAVKDPTPMIGDATTILNDLKKPLG